MAGGCENSSQLNVQVAEEPELTVPESSCNHTVDQNQDTAAPNMPVRFIKQEIYKQLRHHANAGKFLSRLFLHQASSCGREADTTICGIPNVCQVLC